ncbi:MAG TPA: TetR/AcrR family transcriptional regulator [Polyangiaceae bacterium]|nr:TetR/AcrR family transcriptional regulator [Polyangiaceae bacterium]
MPDKSPKRGDSTLQPRKIPRQARAQQMKADLLEAAARVLAQHGADHFTTNHVAEAAGASVGSVYQYFPNKASLLVALHERDAQATWQQLAAILDDRQLSPRARFEALIVAFFDIQAEAAEHHRALNDAQASVTTAPDFLAFEKLVIERLEAFLRDVQAQDSRDHAFWASFTFTVATSVGERITLRNVSKEEAARTGAATARMLAEALRLES